MKNNHSPEIRFPEFTKNWGERKFKDFISKAGKKNTKGENYPAYSVSNKLGLVSQTEQFDGSRLDELDKTSYKLVNPNEFAYNPARINVGSIAFNDLNKTVIVSSLYVVLKMSKELDNDFILQYIKSQFFIDEVRRNTEGSVRDYLFYENFKNIKFPYTSSKVEQIKIGNFFKQLDDTIALHQQELNTLKQTKQGFLQKMFPKEGKSVPEVRFPGFTGEWEQRRLGDIGSVAMCKRIFKEQTSENGEIPFYKIGTFGAIPDSFISRELFDEYRSKYSFPESGDVLISASGTIGRTIVYNGEEAYYQDSNIVWLKRDKGQVDNSFLQQFYQIVKWTGIEGSTIKRLYNNNILSTEILLPSMREQTHIGNFFKQLDDTIALHQRELDALKETKKAFLQKMFV
ncbi:restriction endonuclease subunit S [Brevibacillus sp. VP]|uniref:restriction endonuclease subunit S n=1 Tax=unclassified Brevibacillus TaxID=2684853 RepID=UPI00191BDBAD|nr:restriction endonuclease subunit S [Brevibacillus sp. VP]